ncbi:MAG: two component transcriptional regulator, winged helix family [Bacteroidetes bacterium]|nr:MAG: two component transcriptional regulator, winged helix family [Bacteroidota bacterium]
MAELKILYVEDEPFLGKIVRESLESRGFEVYMETDGANVHELFDRVLPDVCILDVMLPNKDGFTLAREMREKGISTPIIFLTAKTQTENVVEGFSLGGNDYIRKPFSMEELIVRIQNVLRLPSGENKSKTDTLQLGRYTLHLNRQVLVFGGEEKKLSFRECELLRLLAEQPNEIADRRAILKKIWNDDNYFNSRNLDVYITRLRNYLKQDTSIEIITVKGVGYRFVLP